MALVLLLVEGGTVPDVSLHEAPYPGMLALALFVHFYMKGYMMCLRSHLPHCYVAPFKEFTNIKKVLNAC